MFIVSTLIVTTGLGMAAYTINGSTKGLKKIKELKKKNGLL